MLNRNISQADPRRLFRVWLRHPGCKDTTTPKTRTEFWQAKFDRNVENDKNHKSELEQMGYKVIVLWECEIDKHFDETMENFIKDIKT